MPKAFLVNKKKRPNFGYVECAQESCVQPEGTNERLSTDEEVSKDEDFNRCKATGSCKCKTVGHYAAKTEWMQHVFEEEPGDDIARRCIGIGSVPAVKIGCAEDVHNSSSSCMDPILVWKEIGRLQASMRGGGEAADNNRKIGIVPRDSEDSPLDNDYSNDDDDDEDGDDDDDGRKDVDGVFQKVERVCRWASVPLLPISFNQNEKKKTEEEEEAAGALTLKVNPFINCPPLTPDVDTNRLYPKIKTPASATGDVIRIALNDSICNNSNSNINGTQVSQGSPIDECLVHTRPDQPYHLRTEIHVTDLYLHHRYLSFPFPPRPTLQREREWQQQGTTLFETGNDERHLPELTYSSSPVGVPAAPRQVPSCCIDGVLPSSKRLIRLPAPRFQCTSCQKSYSTMNGLSKHREFHCLAGSQPRQEYHCHQCDKVYTSVSALKMHIRTHTLPCRCKLCGKAFSRPWLLQGHLRTHTGEKPFQCNHCGRAFADRSNLRAHLQTHYEVKQYNCPTCHKTFSRMSLLLKHQHNSCI